VLAEGQAALSAGFRWEDYFALAVDPSDDCSFWYVGDSYKAGQALFFIRGLS
jgi:hypothetical protein